MLRAATEHGGRVEFGSQHIKVFDGQILVASFSYGTRFEGAGDMARERKRWRERGWL